MRSVRYVELERIAMHALNDQIAAAIKLLTEGQGDKFRAVILLLEHVQQAEAKDG